MSRKLYQEIEGKIDGISDDGSGVIDLPGQKPILIYNTLPKETVRAVTHKRVRGAIRAELTDVLQESKNRIEPMCPYAAVCGGCKWQHAKYEYQLKMKLSLLTKTFHEHDLPCPVVEVEPCPETFYYRNRMDYVFGADGTLGLKEPGKWWSALDLHECFLMSPEATEILNRVRDWATASGLPFWDSREHTGFFRYLVIREGKNTGQRLIMLVTHYAPTEESIERVKELDFVIGDLATSIVWGVNTSVTDVSIADQLYQIKGDPWLDETINGYAYRIHPNSFFQTNSVMAARLQDTVKEFCGELEDKNILDLYCGSGFFSMALANEARNVMGIELDAEAIVTARENAELNNVDARFYVGKAENYDWIKSCPQVVILDPPRSGLHPNVLKTLHYVLPQRIVYVSCKYQRFVDELPMLLDHYKIKDMRALDLFPHTPHVEIVTLLERV